MNLEQIPRSFWHSLSVSVLIFTLGTVYVTYKSGNLSLKYKDFEFATAHTSGKIEVAKNEIEEAKKALEEALASKETEFQRLITEKKVAEDALAMAKKELAEIKATLAQKGTQVAVAEIAKLEEKIEKQETASGASTPYRANQSDVFSKNQVRQVQDRLKNIDAIQQTLRDVQFK